MLALDAGQFLPLELIPEYTDYDVRIIDKDSFGLTWGEVGIELGPDLFLGFFRWPGYYTVEPGGSLGNYIRVLGEDVTGSSIASLDKNVLFMAAFPDPPDPYAAAEVVGVLHYYGFSVLVFTIDFENPAIDEWPFLYQTGVDGMYVDDIPMGLMMEGN